MVLRSARPASPCPATPTLPAALSRLLLVLAVVAGALLAAVPVGLSPVRPPAAAAAGTGDDYPTALRTPARDAVVDPWLFYNRECTSFTAWRLNQQLGTPAAPYAFSNTMRGPNGTSVHFGNAGAWRDAAVAGGWRVDQVPAVGAVAWFAAYSPGAGRFGHVAIVTAIAPDGTVSIEEYNVAAPGVYGTRTGIRPSGYLHIADTPPGLVAGPATATSTPLAAGWSDAPTVGRPTTVRVRLSNATDGRLDLSQVSLRLLGAGLDTTATCQRAAVSLPPAGSLDCVVTATPAATGTLRVTPGWVGRDGTAYPGALAPSSVEVGAPVFADLPATGAAPTQAAWSLARRVLPPVTDGSFAPDAVVSRQQLARALYVTAGSPAAPVRPCGVAPARSGRVLSDRAIAWATCAGVLPPAAARTPAATANRGELAGALYVMAGRPAATTASSPTSPPAPTITDVAASDLRAAAIRWAVATGRLTATGGLAAPDAPVRRLPLAAAAYVQAGGR
ncbi:CHAP domain-containing protein [Arsenicicoccus sp. oral taxon 190]|uniref:CHAP domain-containing protein n=1 Tax=Arsenicicoccus sp. oral taxon 190 TaxID=1658671 RepID=UPI00067D538F|nr:CHAP domain-containing protein [Arsenicicoccus sp. oral taxon 190]